MPKQRHSNSRKTLPKLNKHPVLQTQTLKKDVRDRLHLPTTCKGQTLPKARSTTPDDPWPPSQDKGQLLSSVNHVSGSQSERTNCEN